MHIILLQCILFQSQHFEHVMRELAIGSNIANYIYNLLKQIILQPENGSNK